MLTSCGGGGSDSALPPPPATDTVTIERIVATPNPSGLAFGFWEDYDRQAVTLELLGKRPTSRAGFDAWAKIETAPGTYDFAAFDAGSGRIYQQIHQYGETIFAAINISFSDEITPGKRTIPGFYPGRISDPTTRAAAKQFLRAYVQHMLALVGRFTLTIDYEIVSNYRLSAPGSEARAAEWGAWYVEAAAVARQAAADAGKADWLRLQPIVNGNPFDTGNPIGLGPAHNPWLINVVAASDALALDTYHSDPGVPASDPKRTLDIIKFWLDNYAGTKDVVVTENGFTTITEVDPTITRAQRDWKNTGTEAEQAAYFQSLFEQLKSANLPGGAFRNRLRSFNIWAIADNVVKPVGNEDRYFGLIRDDGTAKPAAAIVKSAIGWFESDPVMRPWNPAGVGTDVSAALKAGNANVALGYRNGDDFDFLRYHDSSLAEASHYTLEISLDAPASLIISINGAKWLLQNSQSALTLDVTPYCKPGAANTIYIYVTDSVFPSARTVRQVRLVHS
ncbi:hypothetical protein [Niveibacterium umoris]|uniref:hypothetical protein n=1 Tax=Niveibacterium umoris TaxID=1193620 RepID=UPI001C851964|nr:hypothetical protein [Niveibacterium umoris]